MAMQLQRIVILGLQASDHRLLLMIAAQSPMIVYEDSSGPLSQIYHRKLANTVRIVGFCPLGVGTLLSWAFSRMKIPSNGN
jgi:hypothetical protein